MLLGKQKDGMKTKYLCCSLRYNSYSITEKIYEKRGFNIYTRKLSEK